MIHAGIDLGVRKLAIGIPQMALAASIELQRGQLDRESELLSMQDFLHEQVEQVMALWVEMPYLSNGPHKNQTTTIAMAEVVGMVRSAGRWAQVSLVGQSTWKAQLIGSGRASKENVDFWLSVAHRDLHAQCDSQDEVDAMCIGIYGLMLDRGEILPPVHRPRRRHARKAAG